MKCLISKQSFVTQHYMGMGRNLLEPSPWTWDDAVLCVPPDNTWSEWSNCTEECGRGTMMRYSVCGNDTCVDNQYKEEKKACNTWNKTTCPST